jgi:hypothetical protein
MQTWDVIRRDGNGRQSRVAAHVSRIDALAQVLSMESLEPVGGPSWVAGPPGPVMRTNRDLYLHFLGLGRQLRTAAWSLSAYLRALCKVSGPLSGRATLEPDEVAAMFAAAAATPPGPYAPQWSTANLALPGPVPEGHADWERVILSQLADLEDFVRFPPSAPAPAGVDAPRPPGAGARATPRRWRNLEPAAYLECAAACGLGGWDAADGWRTPLPGAPHHSPVRDLSLLTWADLARVAVCGQLQE